jgi:putative sigma-54 modulation protein
VLEGHERGWGKWWSVTVGKKSQEVGEMQIIIKGKNIEVTEWLREYVEKKIGKLDRYLPGISEVRVELAVQKAKSASDRQVAQITLRSNGTILRAEERSDDMFASIDAVSDKLHRQVARFKEKRERRGRPAPEQLPPDMEDDIELPDEEEDESAIVRVKRFLVRPMSEDEAIDQMELLGHDFFLFYNADTDSMNVVYRRKDGNYGLLQPEVG